LADASIREERVSLPRGTTVRIIDFLKTLPVRRQAAFKSVSKSLIKIKKLLQSYALARPSVRFSLKLLKAKNDNGNWIYAPHNGDYIPEAARNILGKDVAEQCQWKLWQPLRADDEAMPVTGTASSAKESYIIEALLPKSNYGR
jgi:DNA mismatch repair ATPase MutL